MLQVLYGIFRHNNNRGGWGIPKRPQCCCKPIGLMRTSSFVRIWNNWLRSFPIGSVCTTRWTVLRIRRRTMGVVVGRVRRGLWTRIWSRSTFLVRVVRIRHRFWCADHRGCWNLRMSQRWKNWCMVPKTRLCFRREHKLSSVCVSVWMSVCVCGMV